MIILLVNLKHLLLTSVNSDDQAFTHLILIENLFGGQVPRIEMLHS